MTCSPVAGHTPPSILVLASLAIQVGSEQATSSQQDTRAQEAQAPESKSDQRPAKTKSKTSTRRKRAAAEEKRRQQEAEAEAAKRKADEDARKRATPADKDAGVWIAWVVLLAGLLFLLVWKAARVLGTTEKSNSGHTIQPYPASQSLEAFRTAPPLSTSPPATAPWVAADRSTIVGGFELRGFVYVGRQLRSIKGAGVEPALIDPSKSVAASSSGFDPASIPYWPSYCDLSPAARHAYLEWHASGRSNPDAPISFVFLYFYGLERRLLYDYGTSTNRPDEYEAIVREVERLLTIYSDNGSFRRYSSSFLEIARAIHHSVDTDAAPPEYPIFSPELPSRLRIALGLMARDSKPIPAVWASAWISADPLFGRRTPFTRCNGYFKDLFALRYRERWGEGVIVKPNRTTIRLQYQPASASFSSSVTAQTDLPDITVLKEPIGKLRELGSQCQDELDAYSRYIGRNPGASAHPAAMALLPPPLLAQCQTGDAVRVRKSLSETVGNGALIRCEEVLLLLGTPAPAALQKKDAVSLAQYLGSLGYGVEPDVRFGGPVAALNSQVYLFPIQPSAPAAPSQAYSAATLLIRLAALVSAADGTVGREEEDFLRQHIQSALHLSDAERARLQCHLRWVMEERPGLSGVKKRIDSMAQTQRQAVGTFLAAVANADGYVSPQEIDTLKKLYRLLGLDPETVYTDAHQAATQPLTVESAAAPAGFALPARKRTSKAAVHMNSSLIESKLRETAAVSALLASVFAEEAPSTPKHAAAGLSIEGFDHPTSDFLLFLSTRLSWTRAELEHAASEHSLLLDGTIENINDAAFARCDEPALEGDDPVEVNTPVLLKLLERSNTQ
jgi:uncharacterized tellurite resistance protein B-like protein